MRTFVKFNQRGEIVATLRVDSLPEGLQQPFVLLQPGESVAEVAMEEGAAGISLADLHQGYQVDPRRETLVPLPAAPEPAPKRPSKRKVAAKPAPVKARPVTRTRARPKAARTKKAAPRKKRP